MPEYFYADRLFNALEREDPAPGMLLVAAPGMLSPEFARTVVLVLEHTAEQTIGVVLNRRSELAVANIMPEWVDLMAAPQAVYVGGPVEPQAGIGVGVTKNGVELDGHPYFTRLANRLVHVDLGADPAALGEDMEGMRVYAGYAGWEQGQLDDEIQRGDWYIAPALPSDVVAPSGTDLWTEVLRRQPMPLPLFATFSANIEDN